MKLRGLRVLLFFVKIIFLSLNPFFRENLNIGGVDLIQMTFSQSVYSSPILTTRNWKPQSDLLDSLQKSKQPYIFGLSQNATYSSYVHSFINKDKNPSCSDKTFKFLCFPGFIINMTLNHFNDIPAPSSSFTAVHCRLWAAPRSQRNFVNHFILWNEVTSPDITLDIGSTNTDPDSCKNSFTYYIK